MSQPDGVHEPRSAVVVGGAGFLGRRLVEMLVGPRDEGRFVDAWPWFESLHVIDVAPFVPGPALEEALARSGQRLSHARADVCSLAQLETAFEGAHTVFHLASVVDVGLRKNPRIEAVNVGGARNVVQACLAAGVRCLVYTSSEDVVLSETPVSGGDESIPYPTAPIHDYVRTKIEGEKAVLAANGRGGLFACAIRPVHLYGAGDPHAIKVSLKELGSGKLPFLLGDGSARFDIVHVDNVVHGHLLAARALATEARREGVAGEAFLINEGNAPNYFEFLRPYAESRGIRLPRIRLPDSGVLALATLMEFAHRAFGVDVPFHRFHRYVIGRDFYFTTRKAEERLGYRPIVSPEEGQARTIAWLANESLD